MELSSLFQMAPSLMLTKMPMTPFRVMALVAGVAAICLVFSALTTTERQQKLGAVFEQPSLPNKVGNFVNAQFIHSLHTRFFRISDLVEIVMPN